MKKTLRISALILVLAMLLCALAGCGSESTKNVPAADITAAVADKIGKTGAMTAAQDNWIKGYMKVDVASFGDYSVMVNAIGANVDEFGVFKAGDMKVSEMESTVKAYLDLRLQSWMDEYMPEEKYKVEDAEYKVVGDYVMYCILSGDDAKAAFETFEGMLK